MTIVHSNYTLDLIGYFGPFLLAIYSIFHLWDQIGYLYGYMLFFIVNSTMNKIMKLLFLLFFLSLQLIARSQSQIEMADDFRGEGKIYVVIMVVLLLLGGIFFTLFRFGRRLSQLEKQMREEK